jgi:hypothetical protein
MADVSTDPRFRDAQLDSLNQLDEISRTGMTARDEADLLKLRQDVNRTNRGRQGAIQQNMASRGMSGSGMDLVAQMQASQDATEREALAALEKNAQIGERKQQAMMQRGSLAGDMRGQEFNEQAAKAQAQDAINRFNTSNSVQAQFGNNQGRNQTNQANWGRQNQTSDRNVQGGYDFRKDSLSTQQAGSQMAYNKAVDDWNRAQMKKQRKGNRAGNMFSGAAQGAVAGGTVGGPWGAVAGGVLGAAANYAQGGRVDPFDVTGGFRVPGQPQFPFDTEADDTVPAMLSPGEIVIPKTAAQDPASAAAFAAQTAAEAADPQDQFSSIKNPMVRDYMRSKMQARKEMEEAEKSQKWLGAANMAGKVINDAINNRKEDVILKNRMQDLGRAPGVAEAKRNQWDGSLLDRMGQEGVDKAKGKLAQAGQDFDETVKLTKFSRDEDTFAEQETKRKAFNDPKSAESVQARDYLRTVAPGVADKMANFENLSAAQIEKVAPGLFGKYKLDRSEAQKAADRASMERRTSIATSKPTAAEIKEAKEIKALEAGGSKQAKVFDDLRALRAESNMTGPVAGRVGKGLNAFGVSVSPEFDQMNARQMSMVNEYIKATTGASASESEMKRLMAVMPDVADTDDLYENKMKALQETTEAIINERRAAAGLPPRSTGATGSWDDQPAQKQTKKYDWED